MSGPITLGCLVYGETFSTAFPVEVKRGDMVHTLKTLIKKERPKRLGGVDTPELQLWKVEIQNGDRGELQEFDPKDEALNPLTKIGKLFGEDPPEDHIHIIIMVPDEPPLKRPRTDDCGEPWPVDISADILLRWSKSQLSIPSISELPGILNKPLPQDGKIPLSRMNFENLLSSPGEMKDFCRRDHVERLFRVSDTEASRRLLMDFYGVVLRPAPLEDGSEASFIYFWDDNIRKILELLVPSGRSIRDSNFKTSNRKLRPDYGFLLENVCPFRGEEKSPTNPDDPKDELYHKLTWTYSPAPYVFAYYANGADVTLAAICAPSSTSGIPFVQDIASADLRLKRDRIANLCQLINLAPYFHSLAKLIGYRDVPEFITIVRHLKSVEIGRKVVRKVYHGVDGAERVRYVQNVYQLLKDKEVPHVDTLTHAFDSTIYVEPKGITVRPSNEKELLEAIICVLQALQVLHKAPPLFHRDIRWPNIVQRADNSALWFFIDWDDAVGPCNKAAQHFCREQHSPHAFVDNHGGEVDIWGVGLLIQDATGFAFNISPKLVEFGKWMQNEAPSAQNALISVEAYVSQYVTNPCLMPFS